MRIPTLAIHLDRSVSESFKFNVEEQLTPVLAQTVSKELEVWFDYRNTSKNHGEQTLHHPELLEAIAMELKVQGNLVLISFTNT